MGKGICTRRWKGICLEYGERKFNKEMVKGRCLGDEEGFWNFLCMRWGNEFGLGDGERDMY